MAELFIVEKCLIVGPHVAEKAKAAGYDVQPVVTDSDNSTDSPGVAVARPLVYSLVARAVPLA